jgi:hypothetical protein
MLRDDVGKATARAGYTASLAPKEAKLKAS